MYFYKFCIKINVQNYILIKVIINLTYNFFQKDPQQRPTTEALLQHAFICQEIDGKPVKDLLLEYRAEVVEEVVDDEAEVNRNSIIYYIHVKRYFQAVILSIQLEKEYITNALMVNS